MWTRKVHSNFSFLRVIFDFGESTFLLYTLSCVCKLWDDVTKRYGCYTIRMKEEEAKKKKICEEGNFYLLWNDCKVRSKVLLTEFSITIKKKWMLKKVFLKALTIADAA